MHSFTRAVARTLGAALVGTCAIAAAAAAESTITVTAIDPPPAAAAESAVAPALTPTSPTNLVGQSVRPGGVVLLWRDRSTNESSFIVEGKLASDPTFSQLGTVSANVTAVTINGLPAGSDLLFRVRASNASGASGSTNAVAVTTLATSGCVAADNAMCLQNSEFRVQALFLTQDATGADGPSGEARAVKLVSDSGYLWFFNDSNIEAVVKVLNGCAINSRFWVFAGGLTNVRVVLTVTDTVAGASESYSNPQSHAFQPIQDTEAFATCN